MKKKTRRQKQLERFSHHTGYMFVLAFALIGAFLVYASYAAIPVHYSIVVVAGQSNADGAESYVLDPANNFDLFGAKGHPADGTTKLVWSNLSKSTGPPPVTLKDIGTPSGQYVTGQAIFGPEVGLARGLYDQGRRNVLVLKVSYGGLSLAQKDGMDWNANSPNEAYSNLVNRLKDTKAWIASQGCTASVDGFYWVQGEGDTNPTYAPLYEANLRNLVSRARTDLGMSSQAPVVIAKTSLAAWIQTAQNLTKTNPCGAVACDQITQADNTVRAAQQKVADTMSNVKTVDTLPLPHHGFMIHLSNVGELQLGALFAQATLGSVPPTAGAAASSSVAAKPSSTKAATSGNIASPAASTSSLDQSSTSGTQGAVGNITSKSTITKPVPWWQRIGNFFRERWTHLWLYLSS